MKTFEGKNFWAVILGGSSGFGLATAKKLASEGMNIFVVHRDRKGSMARIEEEFNEIRKNDIKFESINIDATLKENREKVISKLKESLKEEGKVRVLLHSIAFGNLKLLAPQVPSEKKDVRELLAEKLNIDAESIKKVVNELFNQGNDEFVHLADPPKYDNEIFINDEDIANTIYSMGTSLVSWTRDIFEAGLFEKKARILGLTSEGNEVAWRGYAAVSMAKVALEAASRAIAYEMGPHGIRSNILQPGVTDTPALRLIPGNTHMIAHSRIRNPLGRLTEPSDVANVVYLLAREEADWINGEIIRVDGGERIAG